MLNEILGERVPQNYGDLNQASEKTVPHWAQSVVRNYKEQFKATYVKEPQLTDHQVFVCFNNRAEYATSEETDAGVVEDMAEMEAKMAHKQKVENRDF